MSESKPRLGRKLAYDKFKQAYASCAEADEINGRKGKDRVCPPRGKSTKFNSLINTREVKKTVFDSIKEDYENFIKEYLGEDAMKELTLEDDVVFKPRTSRGRKAKTEDKPLKSLDLKPDVDTSIPSDVIKDKSRKPKIDFSLKPLVETTMTPDISKDGKKKIKARDPVDFNYIDPKTGKKWSKRSRNPDTIKDSSNKKGDVVERIVRKPQTDLWKERAVIVNPYLDKELDPAEIEKLETDPYLDISQSIRFGKMKKIRDAKRAIEGKKDEDEDKDVEKVLTIEEFNKIMSDKKDAVEKWLYKNN
jgi:hypothetical protein